MKRMLMVAAILGLLSVSGSVFAETVDVVCPENQKLRLIGRVKTGSSAGEAFGENPLGGTGGAGPTVTTQGADVKLIVGRCGGTACVVGVANTDTIGEATASDYVVEPGAAANTVFVLAFSTPLTFTQGISVQDTTGNTNNIAFYECR